MIAWQAEIASSFRPSLRRTFAALAKPGQSRIERSRAAIGLERLAEPPLVLQRIAKIGVGLREIRIEGDGALRRLDQVPGAAQGAKNRGRLDSAST